MNRLLAAGLVVCLLLAGCGGSSATPGAAEVARLVDEAVRATAAAMPTEDPGEVARLVDEAVRATVAAMPTADPVVVALAALLKETPTVEKPAQKTPTPPPSLPAEEVVPADARASRFVVGNASPPFPDGEPGKVSVIVTEDYDGGGGFYFVARNNTGDVIRRISVTAVARTADGEMYALGEGDAYDPNVVGPGEIAFGSLYFGGAVLPADVTLELEVDYRLASGGGSDSIRDLEVADFQFKETHIIGVLHNPYDEVITGPIKAQVHCFDDRGSILSVHWDYTSKDEIEASGEIPFQVVMYGGRGACPVYLITAGGYSSTW